MPTYNEGSQIRLQATFRDAAEVLTNPTAITLRTRDGAKTVTTYTFALAELTNPSTGVFYRDVTVTPPGEWEFWFIGTGTIVAAGGGSFTIPPALA